MSQTVVVSTNNCLNCANYICKPEYKSAGCGCVLGNMQHSSAGPYLYWPLNNVSVCAVYVFHNKLMRLTY